MHVKAKHIALSGLLLAFTTILIVLSGILDFNTLFLLAAASFMVGIIIREFGLTLGIGFFIASVLLGVILAPNKLYCITYGAMGLYIWLIEFIYRKLIKAKSGSHFKLTFWISKYVVFNIIFIPIIIFAPKLIYTSSIDAKILLVLFLAGQVGLFIYDMAYEYFQGSIWNKLRKRFLLDN